MTIPRQRERPRRKKHPIQPAWALEMALAQRTVSREARLREALGRRYMAAVAKLPCCLALNWSAECVGRTTVAHKDGAGMALKHPDTETMAICEGHHLRGPNSIGEMGVKAWERKYGPQRYYAELTRYRIAFHCLLDRDELDSLPPLVAASAGELGGDGDAAGQHQT